MGILKILILFSILSLVSGMILRLQFPNGLAINFIDLMFLITSIYVVIFYVWKKDFDFKYKKEALILFGVFILSLLVNVRNLNTNEFLISALYLIRYVSYFLFFVWISRQPKKFNQKVINIFLASSLVLSILGFIQLAFYPYLRNIAYLGWDVHLYRLVSSFLDPNFAGIFFSLDSILLFNLIFQNYKKNKSFDYLKIFLFIISLVSLIMTYSRSAILMFAIGISISIWLLGKKKLLIILFAFLISVFAIWLMTKRSEGTNILRMTSTFARVETYQEGFKIFSDHPIFGVGFNAYRFSYLKYNFLKDDPDTFPDHGLSGNDNSFLFVLDTSGILGFLAFIYFFGKILRDQFKSKDDIYSKILISSMISLSIASFFVNALFFPMIIIFIWMVFGVKESK